MITVKINVDTGVIMQKISFLLLGTSLSLVPQTLNAQCVSPIQDCYALGYTQTSCPNGKGVKCPFGSGWYCGGTAAQDCIKLGYDKDCTGAGESGRGQTCNGKYQSCTCDSSYQYTCSGTAILAINTPAPAPATPEAPAPLVEVSTPPAPALQIILGMEAIAFFLVHQAINTPAQVLVTLAAPALLAAENTHLVTVAQVMNGKTALANNN